MTKKRKTIALTHEAYTRLKARRLPGETFSEIVIRLTIRRRRPLSDFVGILNPDTAESIQRAINEDREARRKVDEDISASRRQIREGRTVSLDELLREE